MYDLIIEDATIIGAQGRMQADIAVEGGQIVYVGDRPGGRAARIVQGGGRLLLPGFIDTHVHFRDPGAPHKEDWQSGSRAAVSSGVTTVCDMPNTSPPTVDRATWNDKRRRAEATSIADFGIWIGATDQNVAEQRELMASGDACGVKVFMGASTGPLLVSDNGLERLFREGIGLVGVHAEDEGLLERLRQAHRHETSPRHRDLRPPEAASQAVARLLELTRAWPRPVHICHVSTRAELEILQGVSGQLPVTTEVCAHHLLPVDEPDLPRHKVNPPLRDAADQAALWTALAAHHLDSLGSDHAPHTLEEKARPYWEAPAGLPGVETTIPLMLAEVERGRLSLEHLVALGAENPARIFGFSKKGRIAPGYDADFFLLGRSALVPLHPLMLLTRVGWSPFVGRMVMPKPEQVYVGGRLVAQDGQIVAEDRRGKLVRPF